LYSAHQIDFHNNEKELLDAVKQLTKLSLQMNPEDD
jgi:hypothetical protein